ncbi:hypothetical protein Glove_396g30 [Diversispora epigaea]|uniref:Uncharacterized protein n=1 Tax=Diversispora epigaea TaxID=1348612 RepID=A0A397H557_9GLOM|nr:hypothetical protein Glove_396g30 [Diversispora epigaea]
MLEYDDDIFLCSPFANFIEELENEINNDNIENNNINSNIVNSNEFFEDEDNSSDTDNNYYESELELENENEKENEHYNDKDEIIEVSEQTELIACVIIDFVDGKIQRCKQKGKLKQLHNLFGIWQVDRDAIKEADSTLSKLGVCDTHFQFDNKYLHKSQEKKLKSFETGIIQWRRCVSCDKYITFFSRDVGCTEHSWHLNGYNIQVALFFAEIPNPKSQILVICAFWRPKSQIIWDLGNTYSIGQYRCDALKICHPICTRAFDNIEMPKSICCLCYEKLGGHIYHRPGRGKKGTTCITEQLHLKDTDKGLEFLGDWIINISQTQDEENKNQILIALINALIPFTSFSPSFITNISNKNINFTNESNKNKQLIFNQLPSLFIIKMLFIESSKKIKYERNLNINNFKELGFVIGDKLWNSRLDITTKKSSLESPKTLHEYYNAFPDFLTSLFFGIIHKLQEKKMEINNQLAFPCLKIWLPQVLTSLSRKPRLLGTFRQLLTVCHVVSHTDRHERKLENARMEKVNPIQRLIQGKNIWNLAVIDNIDFKEKSFKFGNIYDVTRESSHATLRMAFQIQLPVNTRNEPEKIIELTANTPLFGMNSRIEEILMIFQEVFQELLDFKNINNKLCYNRDFDAESIKCLILPKLDHGCLGPSPNIVILEPGNNPNSDEEILNAAKMYKKDFILEDYQFLDIVGDELVYRRLNKNKKKWSNLRPLLGQWHISKDFCSVLIVLFSSYGLLSLASRLGVRFLDKFEIAVDYRSTARVLDLLWVAVGAAINIFITSKKIIFSEIMDGKNDTNIYLKVWYLYYRWGGIWKAHRMGIRIGNFEIQKDSLAAAAPLFANATKFNYATAIAHYLATITAYPQLKERLHYAGSFKIPHEESDSRHICFAFDEALETFGVKYIKQNINGNTIDEKNLKNQIKACQDERERIDLLMSEYLDDKSVSQTERAIKSRKESLWNLIDDLVNVFGMSDPLSHDLFQKYPPTELHNQGVERLIACYQKGLERIKKVYRQEVLEIESKNTQGRRITEVVRTKLKDFTEKKKEKNQVEKRKLSQTQNIPQVNESLNNSGLLHLPANNQNNPVEPLRKKRKQTTVEEENILEELLVYEELPSSVIDEALNRLSTDWNRTKVKAAWKYHPLSHDLFQKYPPTELHNQGVERLIACYQKGLERIKKVYRQEVLEIESKNTQGRRITEVVRTKLKDFTEKKKEKNQVEKRKLSQTQNIPQVNESLNNSGLLHLPANNQNNPVEPLRKKRKQTTVEEENILEELLVYEELPSSVIDEALNRLSTDWNRTKVKAAWKYRKNK